MPRKKNRNSVRSQSPVRKLTEPKLGNLSDFVASAVGKSRRAPVVFGPFGKIVVDWNQYQQEASEWMKKHNPEAYGKGEWDRLDLICYFIYIGHQRRGECELQILLNVYTMDNVPDECFRSLDRKIADVLSRYNLPAPWLSRWLMFHTSHKIPFVVPDEENSTDKDALRCRYSSLLFDEGVDLEQYYVFSFAKLPPLEIFQLTRPDPTTESSSGFWKESTDHLMFEINSRITEHFAALARQGFRAPVIDGGLSCFDLFDKEQPGWRQNVKNFEIKDGRITPKEKNAAQ